MSDHPSWELDEGALIAPGRSILKALGGGNRFEVYLVWDDHLFALMVAKLLRPNVADDERALKELGREADALARLAHPVLVRGFDAVLDGDYPHVLIEHLEGPTLRRLIRRGGPLPLEQLLPLALHVAAAAHYMANEGMVHLDIKPDNIVMGVPPRLIDLSVARSLERAARISGTVGTDAYMAPEQCDAEAFKGRIGPPADVWGLAATVHHAATGRVPFPRPKGAHDSDDLGVRFPQLHTDPPGLPESMPQHFREAIKRALDPVPENRPSAADFAEALQPVLAALPARMTLGRRGGVR